MLVCWYVGVVYVYAYGIARELCCMVAWCGIRVIREDETRSVCWCGVCIWYSNENSVCVAVYDGTMDDAVLLWYSVRPRLLTVLVWYVVVRCNAVCCMLCLFGIQYSMRMVCCVCRQC